MGYPTFHGQAVNLNEMLAGAADLGDVERALVRERAIRKTMAKTGEGREPVAEMVDAMQSMDREAVLELTDGAPTTLSDALARYIRIAQQQEYGKDFYEDESGRIWDRVAGDLDAILEYPWSAEEERLASHGVNQALDLHVEHPDETTMSLTIGSDRWEIYRTEIYGEAGEAVAEAVTAAAEAIYRAVLTRVIGDRDHAVHLNRRQTEGLIKWLDRGRSGSWTDDTRISVDAVAGGGILVRTRPYTYQHRVSRAQADQRRESTDGIRPHRPMTPEDQERALQYATEHAGPIDAETVRRALDNS